MKLEWKKDENLLGGYRAVLYGNIDYGLEDFELFIKNKLETTNLTTKDIYPYSDLEDYFRTIFGFSAFQHIKEDDIRVGHSSISIRKIELIDSLHFTSLLLRDHLKKIYIDNCIFHKYIIFPQYQDIETVEIKESNFKLFLNISVFRILKTLVLYKNSVNFLRIDNSVFRKDSILHFQDLQIRDFGFFHIVQNWHEAIFKNIIVSRTLKLESVDFAKAKFINCDFSQCEISISDSVSFKDAIFNSIKWGDISRIKASRDIFRQLKFVNDSQGNIIEANRFYAEEMRRYKNEIEENPEKFSFQDRAIFWLNEKVSNFGQNYFLPIFWFFVITMLFIIGTQDIDFQDDKVIVGSILLPIYFSTLFHKFTKTSEALFFITALITIYYFSVFDISINEIANFSNIKNESYKEFYFLWFLHKAILSVLVYHLTITLRRQTKR